MRLPPSAPRCTHILLPAVLSLTLVAAAPADAKKPGPLSPEASLTRLQPGEGLAVEQVLAEPEVAQPVFLNFDERGRLWLVEYRQYPEPAGLKVLSRDSVWRVVYDKVPAPPPNHDHGADRITIHEDTNGDGTFDRHKTFVDGLNIATACARGRGGVWVLNPPYLLFYPDSDNDDVPDADPQVHLEGFGLEDTHSVVNSLCWGPDGWLYAAQGSTVSGRVKRPGSAETPVHSMGQLVWRYHPETRRYEVFAEGGGNTFGVEIDAKGRVFSGHNGGDTRGFHYVQGGYSRKGFDKHGPLSNAYAFGYFDPMKHPKVPRFTHTFLIYDAEDLTPAFHGKLLGVAPLLSHVVVSEITPLGSTFQTRDVGLALSTTDPWFRPVDIKLGPDGAVYVADWYDGQVNHYRNHEGQIDRANGRVYRIEAPGSKPVKPFDLAARSTDQLIDLLSHPNRWYRQTALRLLGDRKDGSAVPRLARAVKEGTGQTALESLWALNLCGGLSETLAVELLGHADPYVRLWSVRLLCDDNHVSPRAARAIAERAKAETNVEARSQLACSARRLPAADGLPVVRNLLDHDEDAGDPHIPLLLWWAIEAKADSDREAVVALFRDRAVWDLAVVKKVIEPRILRRYAASGSRKDMLTCAEILRLAPGKGDARALMTGFEAALHGRRVPSLPDELSQALGEFEGSSVFLGLRQGKPEALAEALKVLADDRADRQQRLEYLQTLGEVSHPGAVPALRRLATRPNDPDLQYAAVQALARYSDQEIAEDLLAAIPSMAFDVRPAALGVLATREAWGARLLEAVDAGKVDAVTVAPEVIQRLQRYRDPKLTALVEKHWPGVRPATSAELQAEIERAAEMLRSGPGNPLSGQAVFAAKCAACHTLFGQGGKVGPELTTYRRDDLDTMLLNVVNPSAEIREGYRSFNVATTDGRAFVGLLIDQDPSVVVLRASDGHDVTVRRDEVEEMQASPASLMPEALLRDLPDKDLRDLFAYLRGNQPPK
jgi:putative heme-binding domain-containing protein